jgi:LysM repeat protein
LGEHSSLALVESRLVPRGQMSEHRNKKQRVKREFFWEIPGDVPGYRTQPDPFQAVRTMPDGDFQLPPHLDTRRSHKSSNPTGSSTPRTAAQSNAAQAEENQGSQPFNRLAALIVLLLMLGTGMLGYHYFGTDPGASLLQVTSKLQPVTVAQARPVEKPKVFELFLGKENKTPQSKLRVITHVVVKGDTLWDIAEEYVSDPFRYPELARLSNIKNPDLIYPYDLVRIHIYE